MPLVPRDDGSGHSQHNWMSGGSGYSQPMWAGGWQMDGQAWQDQSWQGQAWQGWAEDGSWNGVNGGWWATQDATAAAWPAQPVESSSSKGPRLGPATPEDERTAQIHYSKTYQVLSEALQRHPGAFQCKKSFLDLGCAPGGFSCRLLEEMDGESKGFGVTLPAEAGGFPILLHDQRFRVQGCNLMALRSPKDLECSQEVDEVDVVMADAQDLGRRTNPTNEKQLRESKGRGKGNRSAKQGEDCESAGIGAVCAALGIWALTLQELMLGLGSLRSSGTFFFRFGWRGKGSHEEYWYREATVRLLSLLLAHFAEVVPFKSEMYHQADPCFYVVATGFRREDWLAASLESRLREATEHIVKCERVDDLPLCIETMAEFATKEMHTRIEGILDTVGRMRAIGLSSRKTVEVQGRESPEAALWISPVPYSLTMNRLREHMERYGKISYIKRRSHAVGVGADALIQFMQPAHATQALEAINSLKVLGQSVSARRVSEIKEKH